MECSIECGLMLCSECGHQLYAHYDMGGFCMEGPDENPCPCEEFAAVAQGERVPRKDGDEDS